MNYYHRFLRADEGSALVEVALALPVLAVILAGMIDFGVWTERKMQVSEAAFAAAAYGSVPGHQYDNAGIQNAAAVASPSLSGLSVTVNQIWTCTPGGAQVTSSSNCTGYGQPDQYVTITMSASVNAPVSLSAFPSTLTVGAHATYRVRNMSS